MASKATATTVSTKRQLRHYDTTARDIHRKIEQVQKKVKILANLDVPMGVAVYLTVLYSSFKIIMMP